MIALKNLFKCLIVVAIAVFCYLGTTSAEPKTFPYAGEIIGTSVRLRSGPSTRYVVIKVLKRHQRLTVLQEKDGWAQVHMPADASCWVYGKFVTENGDGMATITGTKVNLRCTPNTKHYAVGQVSNQKVKLATGKDGKSIKQNGFVKIIPPTEALAWVSADYVGPAQSAAPASTNENNEKSGNSTASAGSAGTAGVPSNNTAVTAEARAFRELDRLFLEELAKPTKERDLTEIAKLYQQYSLYAESDSVRKKAGERVTLIKRTDATISKMLEEAQDKVDATNDAARKASEEYQEKVEGVIHPDQAPVTYIAKGYVELHGRNARVPASHALVDAAGNVLFYLRWTGGNLDNFWKKHVAISGTQKVYEDWDKPVVTVERCDETPITEVPAEAPVSVEK